MTALGPFDPLLAHVSPSGGVLASFGTDWLYVLGPLGVMALIALLLVRAGHQPGAWAPVDAFATGAGRLTGLPRWCAASMVVLLGGLVFAVVGFFWDVAWHIAIGRDEFLFSPPHVCLLLGIGLIGLAGLVGIATATRDGAGVGWRLGSLRLPYGATALLVAGAVAMVGFGVDELWHWAYGLDVSMWSPPHLSMISAAVFSPLAAWVLLAEAGPDAGHRLTRVLLRGFLSGAVLIALSAWQLEFDLGVPQWQQALHPLLVAMAAGFALCAARAAIGPGGALLASVRFVVIRVALLALTTQVWGLPEPRFVPYLAAAVAVEAAFAVMRSAGVRTAVMAGVGVATVGLAGAALVTQVWSWNPWAPSLLRSAVPVLATAIAAAVLGTAFGRVVDHRPAGVSAWQVSAALAVIGLSVWSLLPRVTPDLVADIRTSSAGAHLIHVEVTVPADADPAGMDRFQVMAWQGGGLVVSPLVPVADGRLRTGDPVPVGGGWKTILRMAEGAQLGAVPIAMPADPAIDASAVPLRERQRASFVEESRVLLREAHAGPTWPGVVGYGFVVLGVGAVIGSILAGAVALDRCRRERGRAHSLAGPGRGVLVGSAQARRGRPAAGD